MASPRTNNTFYVKVSSVVSMNNYLIVTGDKPWVSHQGNLSIGNDPTPVVIPANNWIVVYAVNPATREPINVKIPTPEELPAWAKL